MPSTTNPTSSDSEDCPDCHAAVSPDANFCPHCGAELGGSTLPEHCPTCGDAFDADDEFCSSCGAERTPGDESARPSESGANQETHRAFRRRVQRYLDAGWEIEHDSGDRVTLVDRDIGSIPIHVALFLFTGGIGNLLYGWYHYEELSETRHVSINDHDRSPPKQPEPNEESMIATLSTYALSGLLLFVGLVLIAAAAGNGTILALVFGLAFAAIGLYVAPPVERRLDRRHALTEFGRLRTVDHRVIDPIERCEEPCVVCNEQFDGGLVRRRQDETVIAGVPVRTHELQYNHYCASCARDGPLSSGGGLEAIGDDATEPSRERELDGE